MQRTSWNCVVIVWRRNVLVWHDWSVTDIVHCIIIIVVIHAHLPFSSVYPQNECKHNIAVRLGSQRIIEVDLGCGRDCLLGLYWTGLTLLNGFSYLVNLFYFILTASFRTHVNIVSLLTYLLNMELALQRTYTTNKQQNFTTVVQTQWRL